MGQTITKYKVQMEKQQREREMLSALRKECPMLIDSIEQRLPDLFLYVLSLSELLEMPKLAPSPDGGRPMKHLNVIWEDAAEKIAAVQTSAKYVADDVYELTWRVKDLIANLKPIEEK